MSKKCYNVLSGDKEALVFGQVVMDLVILLLVCSFATVLAFVLAPAQMEALAERLLDEAYSRTPKARRARVEARREMMGRVNRTAPALRLVEFDAADYFRGPRVYDQETAPDGDAA